MVRQGEPVLALKASFGIFDAEDIVITGAEVLRANDSKYFQARES